MWGGPAGAHAQSWSASRVDSHAPLGVMGDHTHEAGEWMLSFRAMRMVMDGNRTDTARVPADGVLVGYPVTLPAKIAETLTAPAISVEGGEVSGH